MTCDGRSAHKVCVGEVQSGVQHEVRLNNSSRSLAGIIEEASAPHWHSALITVLQGGEKKREILKSCRKLKRTDDNNSCSG